MTEAEREDLMRKLREQNHSASALVEAERTAQAASLEPEETGGDA